MSTLSIVFVVGSLLFGVYMAVTIVVHVAQSLLHGVARFSLFRRCGFSRTYSVLRAMHIPCQRVFRREWFGA